MKTSRADEGPLSVSKASGNEANRTDLTSTNHPVHRLPPEIISCIFCHALPVQPNPHPSEAPSSVSATCRSWRMLALSTPALWAHISIGAATNPVALRAVHVDALNVWISRSGSLPLSITLKLLYKSWGVPEPTRRSFERVAQIISSCRSRWRALSLHLPISHLRMVFENGGAAPQLVELTVEESEFYLLSTVYVKFHLDQFPALKKIDFFGCSSRIKAPTPCPGMLYNQNFISSLRTARVGLAHQPFELLSVLAHSPALEDLQVEICISPDFGFGPTWKEVIHLPRLVKLWVQFLAIDVGRYSSGLFLDHLSTPNLKELTIADSGTRCSDLLQGLPDFLNRNRPPVQIFCFEKFIGNEDRSQLVDVLHLMPALKELQLHLNTFLNVDILVALDRASGLLPHLEVVNLDVPSGFANPRIELRADVLAPLLTAMINSRRSDVSRFFRKICYNGQGFEDMNRFLEELNEEENVSESWRAVILPEFQDP